MYLNLVQLAESFGVSEKVVEDWIRREGLPHLPDRGRILFDRAQVAQWAAGRGLAAQAGFLAPQAGAFSSALGLEPLLRAGGIWREIAPAEVPGVVGRVVSALPGAPLPVRELLSQRVQAPGGLTLAPVGGGFALPHPSVRVALGRASGAVALLLLREPLPLTEPGPDDQAVTRLIFFIAPSPRAHLDLLARLSRTALRGPVKEAIARGDSDAEIFAAVAAADRAHLAKGAGA